MEFDKVIRRRQATRKFSEKIVEKEKLDQILEAARLAPSAKNIQPIKIYVINSEEGLEKLDKTTPCRYNSKTVLLVCGDKESAFSKDNHSTYEIDASIAATHMLLEATNLGVDNIWIDLFDKELVKEEFNIPKKLIPVVLIPIGYKDETCPPSPNHEIRKNIEAMVEYK